MRGTSGALSHGHSTVQMCSSTKAAMGKTDGRTSVSLLQQIPFLQRPWLDLFNSSPNNNNTLSANLSVSYDEQPFKSNHPPVCC